MAGVPGQQGTLWRKGLRREQGQKSGTHSLLLLSPAEHSTQQSCTLQPESGVGQEWPCAWYQLHLGQQSTAAVAGRSLLPEPGPRPAPWSPLLAQGLQLLEAAMQDRAQLGTVVVVSRSFFLACFLLGPIRCPALARQGASAARGEVDCVVAGRSLLSTPAPCCPSPSFPLLSRSRGSKRETACHCWCLS